MYARISEDREGTGLGVERQLEDQCTLFTQLGLRLAGVYADNDLSAFTSKPRPDYLAMLAELDAGRARVARRGIPTDCTAHPKNSRPTSISRSDVAW